MSKNYKILIVLIVILGVSGFFLYKRAHPNSQNASLDINNISLSGIKFAHTDENDGEDLIISSDKAIYEGMSGINAYFSISPLVKRDEDIAMQFYFSDHGARIVRIYRYQKDTDSWLVLPLEEGKISDDKYNKALTKRKYSEGDEYIQSNTNFSFSGDTEYFVAEIAYTPGTQGQFLVEAMGSSGSY